MSGISFEEHTRRRILLGQAKDSPAPHIEEKALRWLHRMVTRNVPAVRESLQHLEDEYAALPWRIAKLRGQLAEESYLAGATDEFPEHLTLPSEGERP